MRKNKSICAVDLFCGVGGLTHGLLKAGVNVSAGFDMDPACEWAYEKNNKNAVFHQVDVNKLKGKEIAEVFAKGKGVSLLAGCAPCQPFSTYSLHKTSVEDQRWSLLSQFSRLIKQAKPTLVTMENVPQVRNFSAYKSFLNSLDRMGYFTDVRIVDCTEFGIPQSRKRLVLLASKLGKVKLLSLIHI